MEDECNRAQLELKQKEYQADATNDIINNPKSTIIGTENLKRALESRISGQRGRVLPTSMYPLR